MLSDSKISEMVHPGSALMTGMFFSILQMFSFWPKEHPNMFFLRIQNADDLYDSKYSSDMFYDSIFSEMVHSGSALMTDMFCLASQHPHMFFPYQNPSAKAAFHQNILIVIILSFLLQILCYSYPELPDNVEIYF